MNVTLYQVAQRYMGVTDIEGPEDHPLIQWWFSLCLRNEFGLHEKDETSWCSAAMHGFCHPLGLPMSGSAMARSWLEVGKPVPLNQAKQGFDAVVLWRGDPKGPQGHVGLFSRLDFTTVHILGGNQANQVNVTPFPIVRVLGVRRL